MTTTKKVTLLLGAFLAGFTSLAQSIKVKEETSRLKGENTNGYAVELIGTKDEVQNAMLKYFKALGKAKQSDGMYMLTESSSLGNGKNPVYGMVKEKESGVMAWFGVSSNEWPEDEMKNINKELDKTAYEFGVKFYKDKIQMEIDESTRAVQAVDKQQQRLVNENKSLNTKLENNKKEKIRLEKSLEDNKTEHETLLMRIEKNKSDQDSVAVAGDQIRKVMEAQKVKQEKVK